MTPAVYVKSRGLKAGLKPIIERFNVKRRTLENWYLNNRQRFDACLDACLMADRIECLDKLMRKGQ